MKRKFKSAIFSILLLSMIITNIGIGFLGNSESYAQGSVKTIQSRGLVFNAGIYSDQIRFIKDFFRVRGAQNAAWGYDYDAKTKELVRQFQKEKGLPADGIAGNSTIQKMNEEIKNKNYYNIGPRVPSTNTKGDLIIINKSSNTLYHLKNGAVYKTYPVATGKSSDATPDGKHKVVVKYKNPAWGGGGVSDPIPGGVPNNPLGKRWIGLSIGGGGKYGMHGNASPKSIGKYASMGCVRMHNTDVEKFYDEVKTGTPVWIGSESTLQSYGVNFIHLLGTKSSQNNQIKEPAKKEYPKANIKLDGEEVKLKDSAINKDGTTYYPFRELLEMVGAEVTWDQETRTAKAVLVQEVDENNGPIDGVDPVEPVEPIDSTEVKEQDKTKEETKTEELNKENIESKDNRTENINKEVEEKTEEINKKPSSKVTIIEFKIDSNEYLVNGEKMKLPDGQKPFIEKSRTYIPIRYAMEAFGYIVDWDQETQTVLVNKTIETEPSEEQEVIIESEDVLVDDKTNKEEINNNDNNKTDLEENKDKENQKNIENKKE